MSKTKTDTPAWPTNEEDVSAKGLIEFYLYKADHLNGKLNELVLTDPIASMPVISEMHGTFNTAWLLSTMRDEAGEDYADEQAKRVWWIAESGDYGEYAYEIKKSLREREEK